MSDVLYITVSQAHEITVKIIANLKHVFFNKCSLPAFYEALFYCDHKNFNSLYLEVHLLNYTFLVHLLCSQSA